MKQSLHNQKPCTPASKTGSLRVKAGCERRPKFTLWAWDSPGERHEGLAENMFQRILCWERKRTERSGKPFLVMLMSIGRALQANGDQRVLPKIFSALFCSIRETDVAGWYRDGEVLGVIFTEVSGTERNAVQSLVLTRVSNALQGTLGADCVDQISISFHFYPDDWNKPGTNRMADEELYPDLLERMDRRKFSHFVKRTMDIGGSIAALIALSPLFVIIASVIKLTSKGSVIFRQQRIGQYGVPFTFLKFRSMKSASDPAIHREYIRRFISGKSDTGSSGHRQNAPYKLSDDPRITLIGKFLRRASLDELPQFINVLKGDMSLVGPRPPVPYELEMYRAWHRCRVLEAKPGITGLWQVSGRSRTKFDDMVRLDIRYARTWSVWRDLMILLQTPLAVLSGEGAR
jgi:lipopolysaccharide/colanic/teichoic acid biosynthesis glycosyltransferase